MAMELFTRPYFDELVNRLNDDADFQKKAGSLNLTILMTARDKERSFLLRFQNGKVTVEDATAETSADFGFSGDYATWVSNHKGEAALEKLILMGKIKFKGNMARILGVRSQLTTVDNVSQSIPTEY